MNIAVKEYYNQLAERYDQNRFSNSYGAFIHKEELAFLNKTIPKHSTTLNLGCGSGRFMEFCTDGYDISNKMIEVSQNKFPDKNFKVGCASHTPYADSSFDNIICLHVIMHLSKSEADQLIEEAFRILKPGGQLIIDHPSFKRRRLFNYKAPNWHAANEYSSKMIHKNMQLKGTSSIKTQGLLFFPVHRFPKKARKFLYPLDQFLNYSPLKEYSSYLIHSIIKA